MQPMSCGCFIMSIKQKQQQQRVSDRIKLAQLSKFDKYNFSQKHSDSKLGVVI